MAFDAKPVQRYFLYCQLAGPQLHAEQGPPKLMNACVGSCLVSGHLRVGSSKLPAFNLLPTAADAAIAATLPG